ncbi:hypothetical protein E3N88_13640 [Mikania micrantha]|uniref:Uncharacterized protein n=1 Tax=Mikania micrantha TaxID=192012 RepID=A0A5N6NZ19_9ASTR|nr:hypothetical protein E3N88_13640 [Mikania micrantha]
MAPADDGTADHNVVFIDTSLETRLAMNVSESDTVSEFKQKIVLEHRLLFPAMGDVKIECLKVKQKGNFYHLADSMLVKSAFDASKRNWFVSADASCLEQNDGIQHPGKHKAGDQLALPWVTHSRSIERHDNHGSPSTHSKVVPFVNQRVFNSDQLTSGDSCKDTSKNAVEDRSYNDDKQLNYDLHENLYTVHTNISSKKRTRDFHNESSIKDSFEPGPSLKKKHKTQRVKRDVKASEENLIPTHDNGKVNDKGASINKGDSFKHKSKGNDLIDEDSKINEFTDNNEVATLRNEENLLPNSESLMNNDADISTTGRNISQINAPGILGKLVNQNEKMEGTMKKKKKKKTKKSAGRNEDESIAKHANCDIYENVKEGSLPEADRKDGGMSSTGIALFVDEKTKNEVSVKTLIDAKKGDDVNVNRVDISVENMKENSRKEFTDTNDVATVTTEENLLRRSVRLMKNDADITTGKNISQVNAQSEGQDEKTDDTTKKKKKRKTRNSVERMEEESIIKHVKEGESSLADTNRKDGDKVKEKIAKSYEGLVGKANKNNKSQNLPTKHQSTDVNLESKKSPSIDHHHLPEKGSKNVISTEVSKVNNEVDVPEDESHEIEFRDYLVPGHKPEENTSLDNRKDMKKTKDDSWNDQSQKIVLQNVNKVPINVLKDPNVTNINKINTTQSTKKINSQKMPRQSDAGQTRDKTVKKKSVNSSQQTKSLLTAPLKIFGEDSDDNAAVNSDSSTRTPSRNSSSSSSSSSGESAYSIVSRRNSKLGKLNDLFRSASSFKKVKVTASSQVEDTESQVDFVPESQLMGN